MTYFSISRTDLSLNNQTTCIKLKNTVLLVLFSDTLCLQTVCLMQTHKNNSLKHEEMSTEVLQSHGPGHLEPSPAQK